MHLRVTTALIAVFTAHAIAVEPIRLFVDASDITRQIVHVRETVPAAAGPLTLALPRWLPGYHGPEGKVVNLVDLHLSATGGAAIDWQRDPVELDQFHLTVPADAKSFQVAFDFLVKDADVSRAIACIEWNNFILYPIPTKQSELQVETSITLPHGWKYATALQPGAHSQLPADTDFFGATSLETVIDSPLFAGKYHRSYDVGVVNGAPHHVEVFADEAKSLEMNEKTLAAQKRLPQEAFALFGSQHYSQYQWLLALSGTLDQGLEHHESSDDRTKQEAITDEKVTPWTSNLLAHEFVHSWNGKHRRPAGMVVDDFQQPEKTDLLWVYEGLTEYWGLVLSARSGAWSDADFRDEIASYADEMNHRTGRDWRTLHDVAATASQLYDPPSGNSAQRRKAADFYFEGTLLWLDADVKIRNLTDGKKSLDDFAKLFYAGPGGKPSVQTYTFDDVVAGLNAVAPYDWATFLHDRVDKTTPTAPLGGITDGGYTLDYSDTLSDFRKNEESTWSRDVFDASIGLIVNPDDGTIKDIIPGSPIDTSKVPTGGKILAVNGLKFSGDRLTEAVAATKTTPLELIVEKGETIETFTLDYNGGARFATLKRDASKPDRIAEIVKPLVAMATTQPTTRP